MLKKAGVTVRASTSPVILLLRYVGHGASEPSIQLHSPSLCISLFSSPLPLFPSSSPQYLQVVTCVLVLRGHPANGKPCLVEGGLQFTIQVPCIKYLLCHFTSSSPLLLFLLLLSLPLSIPLFFGYNYERFVLVDDPQIFWDGAVGDIAGPNLKKKKVLKKY